MLPATAAAYSDDVRDEAVRRFALVGEVTPLAGYENFVFAVGDHILRLSHGLHRTPSQVAAEMRFLTVLADDAAAVGRPHPSTGGRRVEVIPAGDGSAFSAVAIARLPGIVPEEQGDLPAARWWDEVVPAWGRAVGRLHTIARGRAAELASLDRPAWHEYPALVELEAPVEPELAPAARTVLDAVAALPQDPAGCGLIHGDLAPWNLAVDDDGRVGVFDFDNAEFGWFARDVAVALYYARFATGDDPTPEYAHRFLTGFLAGYRTEAPFDRSLLETIPIFLRLQSVLLYAYARRLGEEGDDEAAFFARTRPLILAGRSPIPFDPAEVD